MKSQRPSLDSFIPRRPGSQLGDLHQKTVRASLETPVSHQLKSDDDTLRATVGVDRGRGLGRSDIDESLRDIAVSEPAKKLSRRQKRRLNKQTKKPRSKARRIVKWFLLVLLVVALGLGALYVYKAIHASGSIFKGNLIDVLTQKSVALQQDSNGRTNILVLGTSEDDPGHQAGNLTDSMMILSIDQKNKNAYMISIPRDLWVQYGQACDSGYQGKINVYYSCVGGDPSSTAVDADRTALTKEAAFVGNIVGLDIQYGVNVNYTVFRDVVNAIGGTITITINSRDPQGVMDSNFDWKCGATYKKRLQNCPPDGHYIQYTNGQHVIDAEHALYLAQARGDSAPTYGFEQSNFDREKNQQMIVKAIRDKALSNGLFSNFSAVSGILDSLGTNLRTTFQADEIKTLVALAGSIKDSAIQSISLIDADPSVVTTGNVDGQSAVEPSAGLFDYSGIQALIAKSLSPNPVIREGATVAVYNGSTKVGAAQAEADSLSALGYTIGTVDSADTTDYKGYSVYQIGTGMSGTKAALQKQLGVTVKTTAPSFTVPAGTNFVVVVGAMSSASSGSGT